MDLVHLRACGWGLAFVKGLALARHLPIIGIPTLDIVVAAIPISDSTIPGGGTTGSSTDRKLAAVLQAGRGRLAVGWYKPTSSGWQVEGPATTTTAEEMEQKIHKPVIICGELSPEDRRCLGRKFKNITLTSPAQCVRRPGILAELAWTRWKAGKTDAAESLGPIYLHVAGGLPA